MTSSSRIRRSSCRTNLHFVDDDAPDPSIRNLGTEAVLWQRLGRRSCEKLAGQGEVCVCPRSSPTQREVPGAGAQLVSTAEPIYPKQLGTRFGGFPDAILRERIICREAVLPRKEAIGRVTHGVPPLTDVAGMRARLQIKDDLAATQRGHVEHFIETLDDRDLAAQLALLRLTVAEDLEETLRARQCAKARQGKAHAGSNQFRQKSTPKNQSVPAKNARTVRVIQKGDSSESESDASGPEQEAECRRVYLAESKERGIQASTPARQDNSFDHTTMSQKNCTQCGSAKHDNMGCWKRLTCQKCGRKGHPFDHCLFVCRACREIHDPGKCPMEEFNNLIRQWNVANECGEDAKLERSPGWNLVRAERSEICVFAFVDNREKPEDSKQIDNTCELHKKPTFAITNLRKDDYYRTDVVMVLDLLPGESRGYWKYHAPGKWF
ncbi:hypothetical protein PHMEG_0008017 [Phytophthora megakarya]|uniref:CCHC-type domain-containing protein n=1 Tax=Phytophthora megakarya TaxID=4795 RepID=A0A225WK82_9STRA|nr:hypothetical protein PHMEG_0008017 [Phytophthora megakarya]